MRSRIENIIMTLRDEIREHRRLYYIKNEPVICDEEYDFLEADLERWETMYPESITPDSPSQTVGSDIEG